MELNYTYWESNDGWYVGYLNIWPDHLTQGKDLQELEEMLLDLYEFYKERNRFLDRKIYATLERKIAREGIKLYG